MTNYFTLLLRKDLNSIKKKFIVLYLLNITDIIFTLYLINTGLFREANVIMASIINNEILSVIVKSVIPLALLIIIYNRMKEATEKQLLQSNRIIIGSLIFYGLINVSHVIWVIRYIALYNYLY